TPYLPVLINRSLALGRTSKNAGKAHRSAWTAWRYSPSMANVCEVKGLITTTDGNPLCSRWQQGRSSTDHPAGSAEKRLSSQAAGRSAFDGLHVPDAHEEDIGIRRRLSSSVIAPLLLPAFWTLDVTIDPRSYCYPEPVDVHRYYFSVELM